MGIFLDTFKNVSNKKKRYLLEHSDSINILVVIVTLQDLFQDLFQFLKLSENRLKKFPFFKTDEKQTGKIYALCLPICPYLFQGRNFLFLFLENLPKLLLNRMLK